MLYYIVKYIQLEFILLFPTLALFILLNRKYRINNIDFLFFALKTVVLACLVVLTYDISYLLHVSWHVILKFNVYFLLISALFVVISNFRKNLDGVTKFVITNTFSILAISIVMFAFLTFFRLLNPELATTEKPMDLSFIVSFLRQKFPPFINPWYAGVVLNYYYIGQFMSSSVIYLLGLSPWEGYNFIITVLVIFSFQIVYEFLLYQTQVYKLSSFKKKIIKILALYGTLFLLFSGNMYYVVRVFIDFLHSLNFGIFKNVESFFYPDSTRIIPYTINEYPAYSILLGDLHGHYLVMPFVLAFISTFIFTITRVIGRKKLHFSYFPFIIILAILSSVIAGINSWDVISLILFGLVIGIVYVWRIHKLSRRELFSLFIYVIAGGVLILLLAFPFLSFFIPPTDGIGIKMSIDFIYYPAVWGQHLLLLVIILIGVKIFKLKFRPLFRNWALWAVLVGFLLILLTQFFFIKDIFYKTNPPYFRANTVFKIYYTAWHLLTLGTFSLILSIVYKAKGKLQIVKYMTLITFFVFVFIGYFFIGITQRFGYQSTSLKELSSLLTGKNSLNGLYKTNYFTQPDIAFLYKLYKENFYNTVVIEPVDYKSYSDTAKYCIYSGSQCFIAWPLHNMQWYGGFKGRCYKVNLNQKSKYQRGFIDIQHRVNLVNDFYKMKSFDLIDYLGKLDMTSVHFLVYYKKDIIDYPESTALALRQSLLKNRKLNCSMTRIGNLYDIFCNFLK